MAFAALSTPVAGLVVDPAWGAQVTQNFDVAPNVYALAADDLIIGNGPGALTRLARGAGVLRAASPQPSYGAVQAGDVGGGVYPIDVAGTAGGAPPTGAAGGSLDGTYPGPSVRAGAVGSAEIGVGAVTPGTVDALAVSTRALADGSVTAAKLAAPITMALLPVTPVAHVWTGNDQAVANGGALYVAFEGTHVDPLGMHDATGNPTAVVVPVSGMYLCTGWVAITPPTGNAAGTGIDLFLQRSRSVNLAARSWAGPGQTASYLEVTAQRYLAAGWFVELVVANRSGAAATVKGSGVNVVASQLSVAWLSG